MEEMIRSSVRQVIESYEDEYWREARRNQKFPQQVWDDLAEKGWLGVAVPEKYGGEGLGMLEWTIAIEEVAKAGGWSLIDEIIGTAMMGTDVLVNHGSEEQKERWLPEIVGGDARWGIGITEPEAGLNTTNISTQAEKDGDEYVIDGEKIWQTRAADAERTTLLARTTPKEEVEKPSQGLSVFLLDPDDPNVELEEMPLDIYVPEPVYNMYIDDVRLHESQLVGEEGQGLYHIWDSLNVERIGAAGGVAGLGSYVLEMASEYANNRVVFDDPIGAYQSIQHPLADAYADLQAARTLAFKSAWQYDNGEDAGMAANIANLKVSEATWNATEAAMTTFGGMSASADVEVAKMWQMSRHNRTIPVSEEMICNFVAENALDLPRSY
jgi:acyl-CoA dehydrogenase